MEGAEDDPERIEPGAYGGGWPDAVTELMRTFEQMNGSNLDAELAALADRPPWQPVRSTDTAGLLLAFELAQARAHELRAALPVAGLSPAEFPELCGAVDGQGRPVVRVGRISASTGERLAAVLRAHPRPPAEHGKAA